MPNELCNTYCALLLPSGRVVIYPRRAPKAMRFYTREELEQLLKNEYEVSFWKPVYQMGLKQFPKAE